MSAAAGLPVGAGTPARPASWLQMALALAVYEFRLVLRRGEGLLITFVIPAGVLLVFSAFDTSGGTAAGRPVDRLLPGSIGLAVIAASLVALAISTGYERAYGVIKRLGGSPAGTSVVVTAKTISVVIVELVQMVLLVGIATFALGWTAGPGASVLLTLGALVLGTVAFAGLGLLMAGTLRAEGTLAAANGLFLVFLLLGGVILPIDHLPGFLADLARVLPASALSDAERIGLGSATGDPLPSLLVLAAWGVVAALLAARSFRWE
jgi:ABC-2 type transport system permease protein